MTKEQIEACEKLANTYTKKWSGGPMTDAEQWALGGAYKTGFQAAQAPEMLMLNPLVNGLVESLELISRCSTRDGCQRYAKEALAPFQKDE